MDVLQSLLSQLPLLVVSIGFMALQWRAIGAVQAAQGESGTLAQLLARLLAGQQVTLPPSVAPTKAGSLVSDFLPKTAATPTPAAPLLPKAPTEYDRMWAAMQILPQRQTTIDRDATKIVGNKARYETIAQQCGVPWFVIGLIDQMEAGGGCKAHLHNGDPLDERTIHVPAGRPPSPAQPPFTWEQSAIDALHIEGFDKIKSWPLATIAAELERYNGMGYHTRGVPSPYLWSFSNQYTSGKFVKDHVYDPNAVSEQAGAMPILKALIALDPSIQL